MKRATFKTTETHKAGSIAGRQIKAVGSQVGHVQKVGMQGGWPRSGPQPSSIYVGGRWVQNLSPKK